MSKFRHTRGPWKVGYVDPRGARRVEADAGQSIVCYVAPWDDPTEEVEDTVMEANAQLISAAPDLYDAAKGCLIETGGSVISSAAYYVRPERMQALARAVSKAGRTTQGALEKLAQVHDEANFLHAMEMLFEHVHGEGTYGGDFRISGELFTEVRRTYNKWKPSIS